MKGESLGESFECITTKIPKICQLSPCIHLTKENFVTFTNQGCLKLQIFGLNYPVTIPFHDTNWIVLSGYPGLRKAINAHMLSCETRFGPKQRCHQSNLTLS